MAIELDDNRSVWAAEAAPYEPRPALRGERRADVVVVGGGYTGVATAQALMRRRPNLNVVLLEGKGLGNGASGRNGGMVLNYLSGIHLPEQGNLATDSYALFTATVDSMIANIEDHNLDAVLDRRGSYELFTNTQQADAAAHQTETWQKAGLPLSYIAGEQLADSLRFQGAVGAILDPKAGQINGLRYLRGMRQVLEGIGVTVYENTLVQRIREGGQVEVETAGGRVSAGAVVLATNAYTPQLGYFADRIMALHSHVIATEPVDDLGSVGWSSRISFSDDLGRLTYGSVSDQGRIVIGGGSNAAYGYSFGNRPVLNREPAGGYDFVEGHMRRRLLGTKTLAIGHRWSGPLGVTASRVPIIGVRGSHKNVYHGMGYSGSGITAATLTGRILADLYCEQVGDWEGLPGVYRSGEWLPPEPFRWLGYHIFTKLTGRSRRRPYRG